MSSRALNLAVAIAAIVFFFGLLYLDYADKAEKKKNADYENFVQEKAFITEEVRGEEVKGNTAADSSRVQKLLHYQDDIQAYLEAKTDWKNEKEKWREYSQRRDAEFRSDADNLRKGLAQLGMKK